MTIFSNAFLELTWKARREENKDILQDLLEVILDLPHKEIEEIELLDKELKKDQLEDKTGILDSCGEVNILPLLEIAWYSPRLQYLMRAK